jgi:hypothetical protein
MSSLSKIIFFSFFLLSFNNAFSQEYNYARLSVLYGGNIPFNFKTIDNFKDGIRIDNGTILGVTMVDSNQVGATLEGFILRFRSFNAQASVEGSVYNLPLSTIQVEATNNLGLPAPNANYTGLQSLTTNWVNLVEYTQNPVSPPDFSNLDWANHQIKLSYECGVATSLLGEEADYYTVEIEIELIPTGLGF